MAHKVDPYEGIDFEEINEATDLQDDEIKCLKNCFDLFDSKKQTFLSADDLDEILRAMGFRPSAEELKAMMMFLYSQTFSKDIGTIFQSYISLQHYMFRLLPCSRVIFN